MRKRPKAKGHMGQPTGFPTYSRSARTGEAGVNLIAKIVSDEFEWIFKRNHQEHDFGIDGQIEIVSDDGLVTGQMLAVQIKHGISFLSEKNKWGYVYRGEAKHFNYLANYPLPVIVILCDPRAKHEYWARFEPEQTQATESGWKMTVPFENRFSRAKQALRSLVSPSFDSLGVLREYWAMNERIAGSSIILYILDMRDVANSDVSRPRSFYDRLRATKELALDAQGKVAFSISGYDDDPRELWEIDEVRAYVKHLDAALPELFFFAQAGRSGTLKLFLACVCDGAIEGKAPPGKVRVVIDTKRLGDFVTPHWHGLNEMTHWLGMSEAENKRISFAAMEAMGLDISPLRKKFSSRRKKS